MWMGLYFYISSLYKHLDDMSLYWILQQWVYVDVLSVNSWEQTGKEEPPTTGFMFIWKNSTLICESTDKQTLLVITQLKWIGINGARMITESPQLPKPAPYTLSLTRADLIKTPCRLCQSNKRGAAVRECRYVVYTHPWVGGFTIYLSKKQPEINCIYQ